MSNAQLSVFEQVLAGTDIPGCWGRKGEFFNAEFSLKWYIITWRELKSQEVGERGSLDPCVAAYAIFFVRQYHLL